MQRIVDKMTAKDVLLLVGTPMLFFMLFMKFRFLFSLFYPCFNACYGTVNVVTEFLCGILHLFLDFTQVLELLFKCLLVLRHNIFEVLDLSI